MDILLAPGVLVRNGILYFASILKNDAAPGYVTIFLVVALCITVVRWRKLVKRRLTALGSIHSIIAKTPEDEFSLHVTNIDAAIADLNVTEEQQNVAEAWKEYREATSRRPDFSTALMGASKSRVLSSAILHLPIEGKRLSSSVFKTQLLLSFDHFLLVACHSIATSLNVRISACC